MKFSHIKYLIVALFCCTMLASCTGMKMPSVSDAGITEFKMKGMTSADIFFSMKVENPNKKSLSVESLSGTILKDGEELGTFKLVGDTLVAPALSTSTVRGSVRITVTNPLALLSAGINFSNPNLEALRVDAVLQIRYGKSGKNFKFKDCSFSDFFQLLSI